MATAEISRRIERAISAIADISSQNAASAPHEARTTIDYLNRNIYQFEADGAVGALIVLARKAEREKQTLIIGLETDWIPGINEQRGDAEYAARQLLLQQIRSVGSELMRLGLDNVEIVCGNGAGLAKAVEDKIDQIRKDTGVSTNLSNVVVFASKSTIDAPVFNRFRSTPEAKNAFLAGVDTSDIETYYENNKEEMKLAHEQLDIKILEMFLMTLELAIGKERPRLDIIHSYDKDKRFVLFLPKPVRKDIKVIEERYRAEATALAAA